MCTTCFAERRDLEPEAELHRLSHGIQLKQPLKSEVLRESSVAPNEVLLFLLSF